MRTWVIVVMLLLAFATLTVLVALNRARDMTLAVIAGGLVSAGVGFVSGLLSGALFARRFSRLPESGSAPPIYMLEPRTPRVWPVADLVPSPPRVPRHWHVVGEEDAGAIS